MLILEFEKNKIKNRIEKLLSARYDKSGIAKAIFQKITQIDGIKTIKYLLSEETGTIVFISNNSASIMEIENRDVAWWLRRWVFYDDDEDTTNENI